MLVAYRLAGLSALEGHSKRTTFKRSPPMPKR